MFGKIAVLGIAAFMIGLTVSTVAVLNRESTPSSRAQAQAIQACSSPGSIVVTTGQCPGGYIDGGNVTIGGGDVVRIVKCCVPIPITPTDAVPSVPIPTNTPDVPTVTPDVPTGTPIPTSTPQACVVPQPTLIMECDDNCQKLPGGGLQ